MLKKLDQPTEEKAKKWLLARVYRTQNDDRWRSPFRVPPPPPSGKKMPTLTDAQVFGHEFFDDPPTDAQFKKLLGETTWNPRLGRREVFFLDGKRTITTKLTAGGINRAAWKELLGRDVATELFPELKIGGKAK